ncbi:beta-1,4-galactosyltransferase 7-like [Stegodyphus dumicola]|uniref:beta-1,4-galactosyltransferase 7-like n=1 Tax=Stegodyphus dumicola TaxID=202533 RepID=UPI0015B008DB|nr:beta-1,4-galactosyltransferase 7-like [Stegodyphus dumicola]
MISTKRLVGGLMFLLASSVMISILLALSTISNCSQDYSRSEHDDELSWNTHRLAVIVPFRDRFEELLQFAPHIHKFLNAQKITHTIYVINQVDKLRFNRASLINVGYLLSSQECDYLVMHDVDLLPLNPKLSYAFPENGPFHVASPKFHPKYHYSTFVGGILLLTKTQFELVNGLSNKYWGWGLEDDEFYARMKEAKFNISRPKNINTGVRNTFRHLHDNATRKRDTARLFNQKEATRKRDRFTGLSNVQYELVSTHHLVIDNAPIILHNVKLICNHTLTPWCEYKTVNSKKT